MSAEWEELRGPYVALDPQGLSEDEEDIREVEMEEAQEEVDRNQQTSSLSDSITRNPSGSAVPVTSKWEEMERTEEELCEFEPFDFLHDEFFDALNRSESSGSAFLPEIG